MNAQTTSTVLAVTPASPVNHGTMVDLTATLTPTSAAGTVQFMDGGTALGGAVTVSGGLAQLGTAALAVGSHTLSAVFTPTSTSSYLGSSSNSASLEVDTPPAGATTTTLHVVPAGPVVQGTSVTLTATIDQTTASGTVQFMDGASTLGSPVAVSGGTAHLTTSGLTAGSQDLSAVFTSSDTTVFLNSTSATVTLVVNPPPTVTTTTLQGTPGTVETNISVSLAATVSPSTAAGTVQFRDGTSDLGSPVTVVGGAASATTSFTSTGTHDLSAVFTPTTSADFAASTATLAYSVTAPVTTSNCSAAANGTTMSADPSLAIGQSVDVTVTGASAGETLNVTLYSTPTALGPIIADGSGSATFSLVVPAGLPTGSHVLRFTDGNGTVIGEFAFTVSAPIVAPTSSSASTGASPTTAASAAGDGASGLAATGSDDALLVQIGIALLAAGLAVLLLARRRMWPTAAARHR